jgi:hypothetical protein
MQYVLKNRCDAPVANSVSSGQYHIASLDFEAMWCPLQIALFQCTFNVVSSAGFVVGLRFGRVSFRAIYKLSSVIPGSPGKS